MYSTKIRHGTLLWCACATVLSFASASNAASLSIFNTGVDNVGNALVGAGVPDTHYNLIVQPGSATAVTVDANNYPIFGGPWVANNAFSRWIGPDQTSQGPPGNYVYRTTFNVPNNAILSTVSITGDWATDDPGTDIRINNIPTGQTSNFFTSLSPFSVNSGFVFGLNTVDFYLTNAGGPTGLRVDHIQGTFQIPEPAATALCGGFLFVGFAARSRRRN
jgi:hypothetical protein